MQADGVEEYLGKFNFMKTSLAVAIDYEPGKMDVPVLEASGVKEVAQLMKRVALRYGILIEENNELAEKLFNLDSMNGLPEGFYAEIADLIIKSTAEQD